MNRHWYNWMTLLLLLLIIISITTTDFSVIRLHDKLCYLICHIYISILLEYRNCILAYLYFEIDIFISIYDFQVSKRNRVKFSEVIMMV